MSELSSREPAYRNPLEFTAVDWLDPRAVALRAAMDAETGALYADFVARLDPEAAARTARALAIDPATIAVTVLALVDGAPVGHAALRPFGAELEVKKLFVAPEARGTAAARGLMAWLEQFARERGAASLVLQTGPRQAAAIALYERLDYRAIPPYGLYGDIVDARCYRKMLGAKRPSPRAPS